MLRHEPQPCCPPPEHPALPQIRAGLTTLPRQTTGFPEYRRAMLAAIRRYPALDEWTADSAHDLGVMLFEAWSYVLDVIGFYDTRTAERTYLGTATDDAIMAEIVALTGYRPRPAMVARVRLAIEARARDAVTIPAATSFRSQPFGAEKAQIFETAMPATVWPQRNRWPLLPYRLGTFDGVLRFAGADGPSVGTVIGVTSGALRHAGRVATSVSGPAEDGERYRTITLDPALPAGFTGVALTSMTLRTLATTVFPSPYEASAPFSGTHVILDALYPMLQAGQDAAIEVNGVLHAVSLSSVDIHAHSQSVGSGGATATMPLTTIHFASIGTVASNAAVKCHVFPKPVGAIVRPAETRLTRAMIEGGGWIDLPAVMLDDAPAAGAAFALGAGKRGIDLPGAVQPGTWPRYVADGSVGGDETLETPVAILGNVVTAIRGETVSNETVGSGDARVARQRLPLKKKPLSWIEDAAAPGGRAPQVTLRVDGIEWRYVTSFYGFGPGDRVFGIDMAPDGTATIVGGDGVRGARFPSGIRNIVADYRFGAGAAKPPPGSINQFGRAAKDLARVIQPIDAFGGADAENAADMRKLAPAAILTLDRAVSLADFEAMIRGYAGIIGASATYSWDGGRQAAVVTGWIIADAGDPSATLEAFLIARAAPGTNVRILLATKVDVAVFDVSVTPTAGYSAETVRAAVTARLFDPVAGMLAPRNLTIGAPVFRSQMLAAIHATPGVASVPGIALASGAMPKAMVPGAGAWFDFLSHGQVL